jgi:hypothetical protein
MGAMRNTYKILVGHLGDLTTDGRIISKLISKKLDVMMWTEFICLRINGGLL